MKNTLKLLATVFLAAFVSLGAAAQGKDYKIELSFKDAKAGGKYIFKSKDLAENFSDTITLKKDGEKVTFKKVYTEPFSLNFFYQGPVDEKPQIGNGIFIDGPQTLKISAPEVKDLVIATKVAVFLTTLSFSLSKPRPGKPTASSWLTRTLPKPTTSRKPTP